jgi:hypothetical protein
MARFATADFFQAAEKRLDLLPFRFERRARNYLVSNVVGDFVTLMSSIGSSICALLQGMVSMKRLMPVISSPEKANERSTSS